MSEEKDPTGKAIGQPGCKVDAGKAPVLQGFLHYFPRAVLEVAEISAFGVQKGYAWNSWETVENGINRYGDAGVRHLVKEAIDGPLDLQSKKKHAAHEAWNSMARLELICRQEEAAIDLRRCGGGAGGAGGIGSISSVGGLVDRRSGKERRQTYHDNANCPVCRNERPCKRQASSDRRKS